MAEGRINKGDLLDQQEIKSFEALSIAINKTVADFSKLIGIIANLKKEIGGITNISQLAEANNRLSTSVNKVSSEQQKLSLLEKERDRIEKQQAQTMAKLLAAGEKQNQILQKGKVALSRKNKESRLEAQYNKAAAGSYDKINASMQLNILRYKALSKEQQRSSSAGRKLAATIKSQRTELAGFNATTKRSGGIFRKLGASLKTLLAGFTIVAAIRGLGRAFKNSVNLSKEFGSKISEVGAITKASGNELIALRQKALDLGASTQKTASEVAQLEIEFGKLGFSTKQILEATDATLQLSIATRSDLAQAATVAASTVRGFGLEAKDTQRVVDVMANSFSSSALDINKFQTAMGYVAPVAKVAGENIESTTAMLSVLVDRGIDASTAGTSLRNIFLEVAKKGITMEEAFAKINASTNKNAVAMQLFGKRGATAAIVLAQNGKAVKDLTEKYNDSAGAAARMAKIMEDNLQGDLNKAKSAAQGLGIAIGDRIGKGLRNILPGITRFTSALNDMVAVHPSKELENTRIEMNAQFAVLKNLDPKTNEYKQLLADINEKGKEYLPTLLDTNMTYDEMQKNIKLANVAMLEQIQIMASQELRQKQLNKVTRTQERLMNAQIKLEKYRGTAIEDNLQAEVERQEKILERRQKDYADLEEWISKNIKTTQDNTDAIEDNTIISNENIKTIDATTKAFKEKKKELEDLEQYLYKTKTSPQDKFIEDLSKQEDEILEFVDSLLKDVKDVEEDNLQPGARSPIARILGITDENLETLKDTAKNYFSEMKNILGSSLDAELSIIDAREDMANNELDRLKDQLNIELDLRKEGKANNVDLLRSQIQEEEAIRVKALREREKIVAQQKRLDSINEISGLFTSSVNIIKGFSTIPFIGKALGIAAVSSMLIAYAALKKKIKDMSNEKYKEGIFDYRGEGTEKSDDNMVFISNRESIASADATKRAPKALKGIIENKWTDKDLGIETTSKFFTDPDMFKLNFPTANIYMQEYIGLKDEMKKNTIATQGLLKYFQEKTDLIIDPITGDIIEKTKRGITRHKQR